MPPGSGKGDEMSQNLLDPDYPITAASAPQSEDRCNDDKCDKIKHIVIREFSKEIQAKEKNIEIIDQRLLTARKTLERLRYAVVNTYYGNRNLQLSDEDVQKEVSMQKDPVARSKVQSLLKNEQKRIHPAIKKLLGDQKTLDFEELFKIRPARKRNKKSSTNSSISQDITLKADDLVESLRTSVKREPDVDSSSRTVERPAKMIKQEDGERLKVPRYIEPMGLDRDVLKVDPVSRNKQKMKFRIIIGNTSKYTAPHSGQDRSTHRWLLYVRGTRERPNISHFLSHVAVQLHDSYAPHNHITIKSYPFHLSRRGWGEFPVKLKLHFKNELFNKPADIVHNLSLDRNYTGQETLGAETVVDVWLYPDQNMLEKEEVWIEPDPSQMQPHATGDNHQPLPPSVPEPSTEKSLGRHLQLKEKSWSEFEKSVASFASQDLSFSDGFHLNKVKQECHDFNTLYDEDNLKINQTKIEDYNRYGVGRFNGQALLDESIVIKKERNAECDLSVQKKNLICDRVIKNEPVDVNFGRNAVHKQNGDYQNAKCISERISSINRHRKMNSVPASRKKISLLRPDISKSLLKAPQDFQMEESDSLKAVRLPRKKSAAIFAFKHDHCYVEDKYMPQIRCDVIMLPAVKKEFELYANDLELFEYSDNTLRSRVTVCQEDDRESSLQTSYDDSLAWQKVSGMLKFSKDVLLRVSDLRQAVGLLLKNMPMVEQLAHSREYQRIFPYAVESSEKFFSLNLIKRRNMEWTRAKIISNLLKRFNFTERMEKPTKIWSVKQIIIFSHYHGYFPVRSNTKNILHTSRYDEKTYGDRIELKEIFGDAKQINTWTNIDVDIKKTKHDTSKIKTEHGERSNEHLCTKKQIKPRDGYSESDICLVGSSDEEIDICDMSENGFKSRHRAKQEIKMEHKMVDEEVLPFESDEEKLRCFYVEKICSQLGIELRNESVGNGFTDSVVHKVMLSAVKSLVEDVLRRSLAVKLSAIDKRAAACSAADQSNHRHTNASTSGTKLKMWNKTEDGAPLEISLRHIFEALKTRAEFDLFTNENLGVESIEYHENL